MRLAFGHGDLRFSDDIVLFSFAVVVRFLAFLSGTWISDEQTCGEADSESPHVQPVVTLRDCSLHLSKLSSFLLHAHLGARVGVEEERSGVSSAKIFEGR